MNPTGSMPCPYCGEYPPMHKWAGEGSCPGASIVTGSTYFALESQQLKAEIERLKALCARAADALDAARGFDFISREVLDANGITNELIAQLREIAE